MARKEAEVVDSKFIRGLITETTALNFPENACTEIWNCILDNTGKITRREGLDYEDNWDDLSVPLSEADDAFTEFLWEVSSGNLLKSFVVHQVGRYVYFYDVSNEDSVGRNYISSYKIDLDTYKPSTFLYSPKDFACHYSQGNNQLLIVNKAIDPIMISYDSSTNDTTITRINLKYRDFEGVEDNLSLTQRPVVDLNLFSTNYPEHYYNVVNQGWHVNNALLEWDDARSDMPSNADQVAFFRASDTESFSNDILNSFSSVLNTPAPKGHFILDVAKTDRSAAMIAEGFTGEIVGGSDTAVSGSTGITVSSGVSSASQAFDGTTSQAIADCATFSFVYSSLTNKPTDDADYIGKNYSSSPKIISYVRLYPSSDEGFINNDPDFFVTVSFELRVSDTAPTKATDGKVVGSSYSNISTNNDPTSGYIQINSNDKKNSWNYVWVVMFASAASDATVPGAFAEVVFTELAGGVAVPFPELEGEFSYSRPQTCAHFAGRAWYAGIEDSIFNNNIYYSRIILKTEDYGKCYQANDPTSEFISDLLPDDGGVVRIIEASRILKIFNYQNSLLIFATNGVWRISSGTGVGQGFQANSFSIRKLSDIGIDSPQSLVSVEGSPVWWSENGIYTVKYNQDFDAFTVESLSDHTIKQFFQTIPRINRKYVKGIYNPFDNVVQWWYNNNTSEMYFSYTHVLNMNTLTGAFYPWSTESTNIKVRGSIFIRNSTRTYDPITKIILSRSLNSTTENIIFGNFDNTNYVDWERAVMEGDEPETKDFVSEFTTGYKIHGGALRYNQVKYLIVYLNTLENSGCYVRSIFDFTNSGNSGKWSTKQQVYNPVLDFLYRDINTRRLKLRGRGKAVQFNFTSESGKPFEIIGWAMAETQSAGL